MHFSLGKTAVQSGTFELHRVRCAKPRKVPILLHLFRRSAIRNMIRAGVPEKTAMRISGHVTRAAFDRYDIGSDADLADAAERIENRRIGRKLVTGRSTTRAVCNSLIFHVPKWRNWQTR